MEYICEKCNKNYSSYQSLWIHNKKYHSPQNNPKVTNHSPDSHQKVTNESPDSHQNKLSCRYCLKVFKYKQGKYRHEKSCQDKKQNEIEKYTQDLEILKNKIQKLENKNNGKLTTNIKVNGPFINGNNTDIGPKQIIYKTGMEDMNLITYDEVSTIFDNEISSVIKLIDLVNFSEGKPQNHSFCSTALESPYLSFYNTNTNSVNKERKRYFFEEVVCKSIQNHEILYSKFKNKFNSVKRKKIEDNISNLKKIKDNSFNSKIMDEIIRNLNLLSYNKRDLIQDTWNGKNYENDSDEEFMAMLLNHPETQAILASEKHNKCIKSENIRNQTDNESESDGERPEILPVKYKSTKNIIV
jgi:hypothetical protein